MKTSITQKPVSGGQKEQCATVVKDAARKATENAIVELEAEGVLNDDNIQRILEKGGQMATKI